jgi:hypothetical protein
VGIGNFPIVVYERLMKGLVEEIPDEMERREHILGNMLYAVDICPLNICIYKIIMGYKKNYNGGNVIVKDALEGDVFNSLKFDVIIGNPPYQEKQIENRKTQPLWDRFIKTSIECLKESGYLVVVHPSGWRSPDGKFRDIFKIIMERNLIFVSMNDFKKGQEIFRSGTNFDYYCLQNKITRTNCTTVQDIDGVTSVVDLNGLPFIPSGDFEIFVKLLKPPGSSGLAVNDQELKTTILYSSSMYETRNPYVSNNKDDMYIYPCCYSITQ